MRSIKLTWLLPLAILAGACGRGNSSADDALKNDLSLAAQAQPYNPQQFVSPVEANLAQPQGFAPQATPVVARQSTAPVRRTTSTARRSSSASRSSGSSTGSYYPAQPRTTVTKHTKRDAAIGAAAGAVIGATTSRNKVKAGIIGAAVGGILGGVIGNNVDIERKTTP
jgi:hypothetical protein